MISLLKKIKKCNDPICVFSEFTGPHDQSTEVVEAKWVTGIPASVRGPKNGPLGFFVSVQSADITQLDTSLDALFIGVHFFVRITPELLAWMQDRIAASHSVESVLADFCHHS
jgi:hypothetical protein